MAKDEFDRSEYRPRAGKKAFAAFGLWVSSIIGIVTVNHTIVPQVKMDQDRVDEQVKEFQEMQKNMQNLTAECNAQGNAYNALREECQALGEKLKELSL